MKLIVNIIQNIYYFMCSMIIAFMQIYFHHEREHTQHAFTLLHLVYTNIHTCAPTHAHARIGTPILYVFH